MDNTQRVSASIINRTVNTFKTRKSARHNKTIEEIKAAIEELESIRRFFEAAEEPELVDYAIYREKAALMRLSYLLREAKANNKS